MNLKLSSALVFMGLVAVGCAQETGDDTESASAADTSSSGVAQSARAPAPTSAVSNTRWTEIARGSVSQIKNYATYNNPTGGLIRVHITGCTLSTLAVSVLNSDSVPVNRVSPAGSVQTRDGGYDMFWSLPAQNLGYISLYAWAFGTCYATVSQSDPQGSDSDTNTASSCAGLDEVACRAEPFCEPVMTIVGAPPFAREQFVRCDVLTVRAF